MPVGKKISALTVETPLDGTELVPLSLGTASNARTTTQAIADLGGGGVTFPLTSDYVHASALGAAIANAGSGGTNGPATVTVQGVTGTAPQFGVTITGGVITSIDSVAVAGDVTAGAIDTALAVTGGGLVGATVLVGWSFAPSVVGTDSTSGISFDRIGFPRIVANLGGTEPFAIQFLNAVDSNNINSFSIVSGSDAEFFGLAVVPETGLSGEGVLNVFGYGNGNVPELNTYYANGVRGTPTAVQNNDFIQFISASAFSDTWVQPFTINVIAVEDFSNGHQAVKFSIQTANLTTEITTDRILIDGTGNVKQQNGVFALDTGGNDTGTAIGSLPASPTLGMMAVVNDALAPAVGVAVAATGAAKALVWWNGAQWTVMGV